MAAILHFVEIIMGNWIITEFLAGLGADIDAGTLDNREPNVLAFSEPGGICIKVERGTNQRSLLYSRLLILHLSSGDSC